MPLTKIDIARHQLGTALDLFVRDKDPVSIHSLASGACELLHGIAIVSTVSPFFNHIQATHPNFSPAELAQLQNQYWNAFKHFYKPNKRDVRNDDEILSNFSDKRNDVPLFIGWWDYLAVAKRLPIAAQVFQIWYYTLYPQSLASDADTTGIFELFPELKIATRPEQKRRLRRTIEKYRDDKKLLANPATEKMPLCISRNRID